MNEKLKNILNGDKPYLLMLVGTPLSGKSTFINSLDNTNHTVVSRDEILTEVAQCSDYNKAWKIIADMEKGDDIVDKKLKAVLVELGKNKKNTIIDMTNLKKKGRCKHLAKFPKHIKVAIKFEFLTMDEYTARNTKRNELDNKYIPLEVIQEMISTYEEVEMEEGFDLIITLE